MDLCANTRKRKQKKSSSSVELQLQHIMYACLGHILGEGLSFNLGNSHLGFMLDKWNILLMFSISFCSSHSMWDL